MQHHTWFWCFAGFVSLVAAVGILLRWNWAKFLVYFLSSGIVIIWLYGLVLSLRAGTFPYETLELTVLGLVPGFVLLAATIWSADIVRRSFHVPRTSNFIGANRGG